jgi:hypothetical protein
MSDTTRYWCVTNEHRLNQISTAEQLQLDFRGKPALKKKEEKHNLKKNFVLLNSNIQ